jgi:hypothetical protein
MKRKILPLALMLLTGTVIFAQKDATNTIDSTTINPNKKVEKTASANSAKANLKTFGNNFIDAFLNKRRVKRDTSTTDPFSQFDLTWMNGNDRRHSSLLDSKYITGIFMCDVNYTASLAHPIDNTVVGSTALGRNDEVEVTLCALGAELHADNVRGKLLLQLGMNSTVVPRNDGSVLRGQYNLANVYRYVSEAYGGYHFNAMHGINLDAGIFMSYVGLFSFYAAENWAEQPSYTSDNTPWFFNGVRLQLFPTSNLKEEIWIINGWQSYAKFNNMPGIGSQTSWSPNERLHFISNNYVGTDVQDQPNCYRFHTDNSVLYRYYNKVSNRGLSKAAFSVTADLGFQKGGPDGGFGLLSSLPQSNFLSCMAYHRMWFDHDHFAWTFGGGYMHNPGRYLVLAPTGQADPNTNPATGTTIGQFPYNMNPGTPFDAWDCSTTVDWMPNDFITFRVEFVHRQAQEDYFAGHGGVTSPDGYNGTALTPGWTPDLVKSENRFIVAMLVRL